MSDLQPYERLIIALADGVPMAKASADAGLTGAEVVREAKALGWPDLTEIRAQADLLRAVIAQGAEAGGQPQPAAEATNPAPMPLAEAVAIIRRFDELDDGGDLPPRVAEAYRVHREHFARGATEEPPAVAELEEPDDCTRGPLCPAAAHDPHCDEAAELAAAGGPIPITYPEPSREESPMPPRKREPIPIEPDVAEQARVDVVDVIHAQHEQRLAERQDDVPHDLDAVVDAQDRAEAYLHVRAGAPTTYKVGDVNPARPAVDALLIEDAAAVLQILDQAAVEDVDDAAFDDAMRRERRARAKALRQARDVLGEQAPTLDLLAVAHWIVEGIVPLAFFGGDR